MCVTLCKAVPNQLMYFSNDAMFLRCYIDFVRQFGAPICVLVKYFRLRGGNGCGRMHHHRDRIFKYLFKECKDHEDACCKCLQSVLFRSSGLSFQACRCCRQLSCCKDANPFLSKEERAWDRLKHEHHFRYLKDTIFLQYRYIGYIGIYRRPHAKAYGSRAKRTFRYLKDTKWYPEDTKWYPEDTNRYLKDTTVLKRHESVPKRHESVPKRHENVVFCN